VRVCRVVAYLGEPVLLDVLLFRSDSSLIQQAWDPRLIGKTNLAGWGLAAWSPASPEPDVPFLYRDPGLPMYDVNLKGLARKIPGSCVIAHVRGAPTVNKADLHPFLYEGFEVGMAHNGTLSRFAEMRFDLLEYIRPEVAARIGGSTDSEWIYALLLSQLGEPGSPRTPDELAVATERALAIVRHVRAERGIETASGANLFLSDGRSVVATRFSFDYGCYESDVGELDRLYETLWYTAGRGYGLHEGEWQMADGVAGADSILIASEPLTRDTSRWIEVPEYTLLTATRVNGRLELGIRDLSL
jgi:glutamine amidotransferase